ncbi:MAG: hypothetical protein PHS57_05870 [Alphaproteobacteria bacterium]|nr:hypothetical protein [Alphaproteobacteria bacterium]
MKTVYKYCFKGSKAQFDIPMIRPLHVGWQRGNFCLWALVDTEKQPIQCEVLVLGTGREAPEDIETYQFLGTFEAETFYVFHAFIKP